MLAETRVYNGFAVASWNVTMPECGARRLIGMFEKLEPGQIVSLEAWPYVEKAPDLGGFVAFRFAEGACHPLGLETDEDDLEAYATVRAHSKAFARIEAVSQEDCPAHLVEETGEWYEGSAVDLRFTLIIDEEG